MHPLYIHSFVLCAPPKIQEAIQFNQRYRRYEEIQNVPDRLRWIRHSRGLLQAVRCYRHDSGKLTQVEQAFLESVEATAKRLEGKK